MKAVTWSLDQDRLRKRCICEPWNFVFSSIDTLKKTKFQMPLLDFFFLKKKDCSRTPCTLENSLFVPAKDLGNWNWSICLETLSSNSSWKTYWGHRNSSNLILDPGLSTWQFEAELPTTLCVPEPLAASSGRRRLTPGHPAREGSWTPIIPKSLSLSHHSSYQRIHQSLYLPLYWQYLQTGVYLLKRNKDNIEC